MTRRSRTIVITLLLWWPVAAPANLFAANADDAKMLLLEHERLHRPKSEEYTGEIIVIAKDGKERRKTWRSYRSGPPEAADRLIRFLSPPDVRGVGYLAHLRTARDPDEWLYLPSMKRERRIGRRDRDTAFASTSFSYEDLDLLEFDDSRYAASLEALQAVDGVPAHVITLIPRLPSAYSRKVLVLRKGNLNLLSVDFFTAQDRAPVKRLTVSGYTPINGYQVATRIEMADLRRGTRTIVQLRDIALDRPQPRDRYTIQNLLREDDDLQAASGTRPSAALQSSGSAPAAPTAPFRLPGRFSGYAEGRSFGFFGDRVVHPASVWGTVFLRQTLRVGRTRLSGAVRLESTSTGQVGSLAFDPADRRAERSPISIRELSALVRLTSTIDFQVGRFQTSWGLTDGYSPADAFLPRDLTEPLSEEPLPIVGAVLRGEVGGARFELLGTPTTTPWRLPDLSGQYSPFSSVNVVLLEHPWTVPHSGFIVGRLSGSAGKWDLSVWSRTGVRPAPVLDPHLDAATTSDQIITVPLDRRFAHEQAAGGSVSREYGGWILHNELGVFRSRDPLLGNAVIWSIGGSRIVKNGSITATVASNFDDPPVNPLLIFDRALLPCFVVAGRENQSWGNWLVAWVATFRTVGGVFDAEVTKDVTDTVKLTAGADLPHGAALSPANAFSGGDRLRAAIRFSW